MVTAMLAMKPPTLKQLKNENALEVYAVFLCGLIIVVSASHWLYDHCSKTPGPLTPQRLWHRCRYTKVFERFERRVNSTWLGRPCIGLIFLLGIYILGNVVLSSTILAVYRVNHWASRFGWLGAANMALCVFFGLKNTPLTTLMHTSHTQLNIVHRLVGYSTIFLVFLHAVFYAVHFGRQGRWETLVEEGNIEGIGAGAAFIVLLMAIFRHRGYEVFYVSHILDGGVRVVLKRPCAQIASPGSHCFLWIPQIRLWESHPFTIVSNGPSGLELVMKSHKGFTEALYTFASRYPGFSTHASVDGPYGALPDTAKYDKLVLLAGGSGAAYAFGLLNRIIDKPERSTIQSINFFWTVKRIEHLSWFRDHLHNMASAGLPIHITVYITGPKSSANHYDAANTVVKSNEMQNGMESRSLLQGSASSYGTIQEADATAEQPVSPANVKFAKLCDIKTVRMDTEVVFEKMLRTVNSHDRVLVATCGPKSLMDDVRESVDHWRNKSDLAIQMHSEAFDS
ncbi:hypothetical protein G7054_g1190 [Neopestalotiopsis clavispora]|nr:hypothetical protein G7054_g1190 [Neopestalotiopsis clavispora]